MRARDKMISFRLPLQQYERFRALCFTMGIQSVSELARAAVDKLIYEPGSYDLSPAKLESRITRLENQFNMLARELKGARPDDNAPLESSGMTVGPK
ncbi:MAG TPA: hypothetical protein VLT57_15145 [Bryobacteraceae bacterium]|jgi:hypothetical protein|nr:hypothetical protein [Bryobacteraceae bacterium]